MKRDQKRLRTLIYFSISYLLFGTNPLHGNPDGLCVISGNATILNSGSSDIQIQVSDKAILSWNDFSIAAGESATFLQPGSTAFVLNRVTGSNISELFGSLQANGNLILINPNGIIISQDAMISVGGLVASTLDILDSDFLEGQQWTFTGGSSGRILNMGKIEALDGEVFILSRYVENQGEIKADHVEIGVGKEVILQPSGKQRIFIKPSGLPEEEETGINNSGRIEASYVRLAADGGAYSLAIQDTGVIEANSTAHKDGRIYLLADMGKIVTSATYTATNLKGIGGEVHIESNQVHILESDIDVSGIEGGKIEILGNQIYFDSDAIIKSNALANGNGGTISFISSGDNYCYGTIESKGGLNGKGGSVVIGANVFLDHRPSVDTSSSNGKSGTLTLFFPGARINGEMTSPIQYPIQNDPFPKEMLIKIQANKLQENLLYSSVDIKAKNGLVSIEDDLKWDPSSLDNSPTTLSIEAAKIGIGMMGEKQVSLVSEDENVKGPAITLIAPEIQIGGESRTKYTCVQTESGDIAIETNFLGVFGGTQGAFRFSDTSAKIRTTVGNIQIEAFESERLDVLLQGGSGMFSSSEILTDEGNISINSLNRAPDGSLHMYAGKGENAYVSITTTTKGNIRSTLPAPSDYVLLGGSGNGACFAMVHAGREDGVGNLILEGGKLELRGGSGAQAGEVRAILSAQGEGHFIDIRMANSMVLEGGASNSDGSDSSAIIQGMNGADVRIESSRKGNFLLTGGDGVLSQASIQTETGNIIFQNFGRFQVSGGRGEDSLANIIVQEKGDIRIQAVDFTLKGGNGSFDSSAKITTLEGDIHIKVMDGKILGGYSPGINMAQISTDFGNIEVNSGKDLKLFAGNYSDSTSAIFTTNGEILVEAKGDVLLRASENASSLIASKGEHSIRANRILLDAPHSPKAYVVNLSDLEGQGDLHLEAEELVSLSGNALLQTQKNHLTILSGKNVILDQNSRVENLGDGDLNVVVDYQFANTGVAKGGFTLRRGAAIEGLGAVRIYSSERSMNNVEDVINGIFYVPKLKYHNDNQERWGATYPNPYFGESGFTFFYYENGECEQDHAETLYLTSVLIGQMFYDLPCSFDETYNFFEKFYIKNVVYYPYAIRRHRWFSWRENLLR